MLPTHRKQTPVFESQLPIAIKSLKYRLVRMIEYGSSKLRVQQIARLHVAVAVAQSAGAVCGLRIAKEAVGAHFAMIAVVARSEPMVMAIEVPHCPHPCSQAVHTNSFSAFAAAVPSRMSELSVQVGECELSSCKSLRLQIADESGPADLREGTRTVCTRQAPRRATDCRRNRICRLGSLSRSCCATKATPRMQTVCSLVSTWQSTQTPVNGSACSE